MALTISFVAAHLFFAFITGVIAAAAYGFCQGGTDGDDEDDGYIKTMAFYGVYHSDPINQVIHFIFVPCIFWSLFMMTMHLPILPLMLPALPWMPPHRFTWATLNVVIYIVFYTYIDWIGSMCYFPILYAMYASAVRLYHDDQQQAKKVSSSATAAAAWTGTGKLMRRAFLLHALAWYMQIHPGHTWFEGSKPAIMQSLGGALTSAPLFAFYEGVWALGLRQDLQQQVLVRVEDLRREMCAKGTKMRRCPSILPDADVPSIRMEL